MKKVTVAEIRICHTKVYISMHHLNIFKLRKQPPNLDTGGNYTIAITNWPTCFVSICFVRKYCHTPYARFSDKKAEKQTPLTEKRIHLRG